MTSSFRGGFLRDDATGALATTTTTTGATFSGGFLRAPTGELVTTTTTAGATFSGGFLRAPNGALVTSTNAGVQVFNGLLRDAAGALVTDTTTTGAIFSPAGSLHTPGGALVITSAGSAYATTILAEASLVSYWRLNETSGTSAADSKGTNTGTYTGGFVLGGTGGVSGGKSVLLDGTTGFVSVADAVSEQITGALTLEAWVNPTDRTNFWFVVTKELSGGATSATYEWRLDTTTGIPNFIQATGGGNFNIAATAAPAAGVWSHIAVTRSGATITHYLNGVANGSGAIGGSGAAVTTTPLRIGSRDDGLSFWKGSLAEIALYNSALSGAAVAAHYAAR